MSLDRVEQARRNADVAKAQLDSTLVALQHRLQPGNLASEAWGGVRDKSSDLADGALEAVRRRPAIASAIVGGIALFIARAPLKRAVTRLVNGAPDEDMDDGIVTTRIEVDEDRLDLTAPTVGLNTDNGVTHGKERRIERHGEPLRREQRERQPSG